MSDSIKVLRLIEYTYSSAEVMSRDMAKWTLQSPVALKDMSFKSATLAPSWEGGDDDE